MPLIRCIFQLAPSELEVCWGTNATPQTETVAVSPFRVAPKRRLAEKPDSAFVILLNPRPLQQAKAVAPSRFYIPLEC
jgi:hypothetical protein